MVAEARKLTKYSLPQNFVHQEHSVNFDIMEKVEVHGSEAHPVWKFLAGNIPPLINWICNSIL